MKRLTVYYNDNEDIAPVQALATKMGFATEGSPEQKQSNNGEAVAQILEELAEQDTITEAIPDPVAWQREVRQDRELPYRD